MGAVWSRLATPQVFGLGLLVSLGIGALVTSALGKRGQTSEPVAKKAAPPVAVVVASEPGLPASAEVADDDEDPPTTLCRLLEPLVDRCSAKQEKLKGDIQELLAKVKEGGTWVQNRFEGIAELNEKLEEWGEGFLSNSSAVQNFETLKSRLMKSFWDDQAAFDSLAALCGG